jgi:hypothetical protein
MTAKTNERLTKNYVDTSIDAQRQYTENLFGKAVDRVGKQLGELVEVKLKEALAIIRPDAKAPVSLSQANDRVLALLKKNLESLAADYERISGLRLYRVDFVVGPANGAYVPQALITFQHRQPCL